MRVKTYTDAQDAAILRCRGQGDLEVLAAQYGKPWTTLRSRQRELKRRARAVEDRKAGREKAAERARRLREARTPEGLTSRVTAGRPAWFTEDTATMMKAGR